MLAELIDEIERLCRRHSSPASNPGAHALANKIIRMIEAELGPAMTLPRQRKPDSEKEPQP